MQTEHPASALDEAVHLLDRLRVLRATLDDLGEAPPPGWTREELGSLAFLASMFLARLLASAPSDVHAAYIEHLSGIPRQGL